MCLSCWEFYGKPFVMSEQILDALNKVRKLREGCGGYAYAHCIVDDWNIADEFLSTKMPSYTLDSDPQEDERLWDQSLTVITAFKGLSLEERATVLAIHEGLVTDKGVESNV